MKADLGGFIGDASLGIAAGSVAVFIEDLATRLFSGVLIAVISGLVVHFLRNRLEKKDK